MGAEICEECGRLEYEETEDLEKIAKGEEEPSDFVCDRCKD